MKYKNICVLIYNVGACILSVFTTKPPSSAMARGLFRGDGHQVEPRTWTKCFRFKSYPVPLLTWCQLPCRLTYLQWGLFFLHSSDELGELCNVAECPCFSSFCSVPEEFESSPQRGTYTSDMNPKDGNRNHSLQFVKSKTPQRWIQL